jgi:hypothetical protein
MKRDKLTYNIPFLQIKCIVHPATTAQKIVNAPLAVLLPVFVTNPINTIKELNKLRYGTAWISTGLRSTKTLPPRRSSGV